MRQAAASVTVGTYWPWKPTAMLRSALQARSARRREALRHPQREERGGGILWRSPAYSLFALLSMVRTESHRRHEAYLQLLFTTVRLSKHRHHDDNRSKITRAVRPLFPRDVFTR